MASTHRPYGAASNGSNQSFLVQPSPLNPVAARGRDNYQQQGRGGSHPLSNSMYLESSPTLLGSDVPDEKMRMTPMDDYASTNLPPRQPVQQYSPRHSPLTALYRAISGASLADSGKDERHIKLPRLGYLDGCKFIAAWVMLNGTLFDAAISSSDYSVIQRNSPLYITRSFGLGLTFLLMLSGRSLITPLWDVPAPSDNAKNSALISWARLTKAMLVRPARFLLPVLSVAALQWGLASNDHTANANAVGMDQPYWGMIRNFAGYCTLIFNLFTVYEADTLAGKTFAANLWVSPWFFVSSYAVYTIHVMLGNLSSNRYWIYIALSFFSWTTYNYIMAAVLGLWLADMHAHGHLHKIRTQWPLAQRLVFHAVLIVLACVTQFVPIIRDNINSGMAHINVQDHPEIAFCDVIFAFCWLLAIETSGIAQNILGNIVMRSLGKLSAGMVLLSPAITFTIVPDLARSMRDQGSAPNAVLGLSWLVLFLVTIGLSIAFHFVVELPSKLIGEVVAEIFEGSGTYFSTAKGPDGSNRLSKRQPK